MEIKPCILLGQSQLKAKFKHQIRSPKLLVKMFMRIKQEL